RAVEPRLAAAPRMQIDRRGFRIACDNAIRVAGDPETPAIYLHVRRGCEARLNRSTYSQLAEIALETSGDDWLVTSQGAIFSLIAA
ncbi:MAG: hypothetical protein AAFY07_14500, partial [Pseudomonadota bacterium]